MRGSVNARIDHGEARFAEKGDCPQEKSLRVGQIEQHDEAAFGRAAFDSDDGIGAVRTFGEHLGMPGDFFGRMAHEVDEVEFFPELFARSVRDAVHEGRSPRTAVVDNARDGLLGFGAVEPLNGRLVERLQETGFPGRPDLGGGCPNVGSGEEVKGIEALFGADEFNEAFNHTRVRNIFLLRHSAHDEVVEHEKVDEFAVGLGKPETLAECIRLFCADHFMTAAQSLADVMEKARDDQPPRIRQRRHELGAERIFMSVLAAAQAAEVFDHEQRMLVDRIDVIKVVLHLSDHVTPGRQHAPENGPGIHHHEGVIRAFFELQNLEKGCLVLQVVAVGGADFRRSMPKRAQEPR